MNLISSKKAWAGTLAAGAAGLLGLTVLAAPAPAGPPIPPAQITMEFDGMSAPHFDGDKTVALGQGLQILNNSDPEMIGPHTFTIADKEDIPKTKQEMKDCFKGKLKLCKNVFKAHKVNFEMESVGKQSVENGKDGWDKSFTDKKDGDSWFALGQNESETRAVPGKVGDKVYYFCVIHPEMQGKFKIVAPE